MNNKFIELLQAELILGLSASELIKWIDSQGYEIKSKKKYSLSSEIQALQDSIEQGKEYNELIKEHQTTIHEMMLGILTNKTYKALLKADFESEGIDPVKLLSNAANLIKISLDIQRYKEEVASRVKAVASDLEIAKTQGLSDETIQELKQRILGIVDG